MKTKLKKIVDKRVEKVFAESEVLVVLESIDDTFKLLAEGQQGLDRRMGGLEDRMGGLEDRMGGLEGRMSGLEDRMGGLENDMKSGFSMIMDYLKRIDEEVVGIRKDIEDLKKKKVDWEVYHPLEKRLRIAEKEIGKLKLLLEKKVAA